MSLWAQHWESGANCPGASASKHPEVQSGELRQKDKRLRETPRKPVSGYFPRMRYQEEEDKSPIINKSLKKKKGNRKIKNPTPLEQISQDHILRIREEQAEHPNRHFSKKTHTDGQQIHEKCKLV